MAHIKDRTGRVFGRLTVLRIDMKNTGKTHWICRCSCGSEISVETSCLGSGNTISCGCARTTHGDSFERLYNIWNKIKLRSNIPATDKNYKSYKHVTLCEEWKDYPTFKQWALCNGYSDKLSIDRKENSKGYTPDNCRWANQNIQIANRTNAHSGEFLGVRSRTGGNTFLTRLRWLGKEIYLGSFPTREQAALVRDNYIIDNELPHTLNFTHVEPISCNGWIHGGAA